MVPGLQAQQMAPVLLISLGVHNGKLLVLSFLGLKTLAQAPAPVQRPVVLSPPLSRGVEMPPGRSLLLVHFLPNCAVVTKHF